MPCAQTRQPSGRHDDSPGGARMPLPRGPCSASRHGCHRLARSLSPTCGAAMRARLSARPGRCWPPCWRWRPTPSSSGGSWGRAARAMPYAVFIAAGLFPWISLREALEGSASVLADHRWIRRSRVPTELLVARLVLASSTRAVVGLVVVYGFAVFTGHRPGFGWLWPILALAIQVVGTYGLGLMAAPLGTLLPDVRPTLVSLLTLLTFASPIVYPESLAHGAGPHAPPLQPVHAPPAPLPQPGRAAGSGGRPWPPPPPRWPGRSWRRCWARAHIGGCGGGRGTSCERRRCRRGPGRRQTFRGRARRGGGGSRRRVVRRGAGRRPGRRRRERIGQEHSPGRAPGA